VAVSIAVSSWSLHRLLTQHGLDLLDLPAELALRGYDAMELCHFHLPSNDPAYLTTLRSTLTASGIRLQSLLIDDGDLSHPSESTKWETWIGEQIDVAAALGAERARVIAGKQAFTEEGFLHAQGHLRSLATSAKDQGVRLTTENWFPLLDTPESVHRMLDALAGDLGLCGDYGNWPRPRKYADLPHILPRAETMHAKCEFLTGLEIDLEDYNACIDASLAAGFTGTYVIVNGGPADEWEAVAVTRDYLVDRVG
jgi:sugar phosphate isomerase/epimerase